MFATLFLLLMVLYIISVTISDYKIRKKANNLIEKTERLSVISGIRCKYPKDDYPDEVKIELLESEIRDLEFLILNPNHQDKDQLSK